MDFYVKAGGLDGGLIPDQTSPQIGELSALLRRLGAYPVERQGEKYRNPNGVYLKLMNFRHVEAEGQHGMPAYSQLDAAVRRDYIDDLPALYAEAATIRRRLDEGAVEPAETSPAVEDVEIERQNTETYLVNPSAESRKAERAEQKLVLRYRDYSPFDAPAMPDAQLRVSLGHARRIRSAASAADLSGFRRWVRLHRVISRGHPPSRMASHGGLAPAVIEAIAPLRVVHRCIDCDHSGEDGDGHHQHSLHAHQRRRDRRPSVWYRQPHAPTR